MKDGKAKINLAKPESPYNMTTLGSPFHISPEMYHYQRESHLSYHSYDIYAFGMLLWVLFEGSGTTRPEVYQNMETTEEMREAVEKGILPKRLPRVNDACWNLMMMCWKNRESIKMENVICELNPIRRSCLDTLMPSDRRWSNIVFLVPEFYYIRAYHARCLKRLGITHQKDRKVI